MSNLASKIVRAFGLGITLLFLVNSLALAQTNDATAEMLLRLNRERIVRGLTPYALNAQLTIAAQAHANDLAKSGKLRTPAEGHIGADGSNVFDRVARTGYGAYSWGRRLGENWAHYRDVTTAFTEWMESQPHRANILHTLYREVGIGIAPSSLGGYIYIVVFGAQPNVLPIFINDTATETKSTDVALRLNDELVQPNGDGASNIGHPVEVQISNSSDFANAKWQPHVSKIAWTLTPGAGTKTVYVKYRDAKGRTAIAYDSITLIQPNTPAPTATRTSTRAPQPSMTLTITQTPTEIATHPATSAPTGTPAPTQTVTPTVVPSAPLSDELTIAMGSATMGALGLATAIAILLAVFKEMVEH